MTSPKYPDTSVQLTGGSGNAFAVIGAVSKALGRDVGPEASKEFCDLAFASESYDALLRLAMETVDVC